MKIYQIVQFVMNYVLIMVKFVNVGIHWFIAINVLYFVIIV